MSFWYRKRSPKYEWKETRRQNIWGTMDCIAVVLTNGKDEWLIGGAYPESEDFEETLRDLRDTAEARCAAANSGLDD